MMSYVVIIKKKSRNHARPVYSENQNEYYVFGDIIGLFIRFPEGKNQYN